MADNTIDSPGIRRDLVSRLKPLIPRAWKFEPYRKAAGSITATTVYLSLGTINRHPKSPSSHFQVTYTVSIFTPAEAVIADQDLDDKIIALIGFLEDAFKGTATWSNAHPVATSDAAYLGYDIDLTLAISKEITS